MITRDAYLCDSELVTLYEWIAHHELLPIWRDKCELARIFLGGGFRRTELVNVRLTDEHIAGVSYCTRDGIFFIHQGKRGKDRQVKLTPEALPFFQRRFDRLHAQGQRVLFPNPRTGDPYDSKGQMFRLWWQEILTAAKVRLTTNRHGVETYRSNIRLHSARATFATWELCRMPLEDRLPMTILQAMLGHEKLDMMNQYYSGAPIEMAYRTTPPDWYAAALGGQIRKLKVVNH